MPAGAVNPLRLNTNQNAGSELGNGTTVAPSDQQPLPDVQGDCTDNARIVSCWVAAWCGALPAITLSSLIHAAMFGQIVNMVRASSTKKQHMRP